ncbi:hypothetical protein MPSEU_000373500 [Mayamaea pseudoterrestris]|nr:hypothetical protein MPSEU_000373500 [Mayamaea pseudoterrestris]
MATNADRPDEGSSLLGGTSRQASMPPSPTLSDDSDDLPNNVSQPEQLSLLPDECLSGDKGRPLRHVTEFGTDTRHALNPMTYSVLYILIVELIERFSFYAINMTQTSYLTGTYDKNWNAGMHAVDASTYVSISVAVAYSMPFIGAYLSDSVLGDYWSILCGSLCFYLPGLVLIAATTIPGFLGKEFNTMALRFGLLLLWPMGTGILKSMVNVFGARQFHPLLQSSLIESYYVSFYMCINIGALIGGIVVPVMAQTNVTYAYFTPVVAMTVGILVFLSGSSRYVKCAPEKKTKKSTPAPGPPGSANMGLLAIFRISLLVIPFNIAYSQMATTFIIQGNVMRKAFHYIDASTMNNTDAIAVLLFGYLIGHFFYPALAARNIKMPTTYKFALGSLLGAMAILWALFVEARIHHVYHSTGKSISVLWQCLSYCLIGAGEIFAVSAAYEVAFTAAPPENKVLASALNLFCIGGLPNVICIALYQLFKGCFNSSNGTPNIGRLDHYATAHVGSYFWVLFAISIIGVMVNMLPPVRRFVESIEEQAVDMLKSPKTPQRPPRRAGDESPLIRAKRHTAYLKYGTGPVLYKSGSMRAGGSSVFGPKKKSEARMKRSTISSLYRSAPVVPGVGVLMSNNGGKPIMAGALMKGLETSNDEESNPLLVRQSSE